MDGIKFGVLEVMEIVFIDVRRIHPAGNEGGEANDEAFTIAYILKILHSNDPASTSRAALESIKRATPSESTHFDPELVSPPSFNQDFRADRQYQEFLDPLIDMVKSFQKPKSSQPKQWDIIQLLQDAERSNCIVVVSTPSSANSSRLKQQALRLMTSAFIRTHPDTFSDFLLSPTTFLPLTPEEFCRQEVEPCGKEADHAQIMALAETLQVGIRVAYLDRSDVGNGEVINWVEFGPGTKEEDRPLTLLYRYVTWWPCRKAES